ncbi:MAG: YbhB/YbcL family Raf kinase inhibitor-like protein [Pseudomonadota bacterium]
MEIHSPAFADHGEIPAVYTCDGANRSPPLAWSGAPASTQSFALIIVDPDAPDPEAPRLPWSHWIIYNLPPETTELAEGVKDLPSGTLHGLNDWKSTGYGGPCPPIGRHRYFHKLYALDCLLPDLGTPSRVALERAMANHILALAELVGTYQR